MRQAVRAAGWAVNILWISVLVFTITLVQSVMGLGLGLLSFGEPRFFASDGVMTMSLPLSINNSGYYDITEFRMTTLVMDYTGKLMSNSTTSVPMVPSRHAVRGTHNISINLHDIQSRRATHLFFNDSTLNTETIFAMKLAYVIALQVSMNGTLPWGAPLYNLTLREPSYSLHNITHSRVSLLVSFENHSPFSVNGTMRLDFYNDKNERVGSEATSLSVPSREPYASPIEAMVVGDPREIREVCVYFDTSMFRLGPVVMSLG